MVSRWMARKFALLDSLKISNVFKRQVYFVVSKGLIIRSTSINEETLVEKVICDRITLMIKDIIKT